jgi:competence ComEA-like helix-hairpin-helix protein
MKKYPFIVIGILAAMLALGAVSCDQQGDQAQMEPGAQGEMEQGEQPMEGQPGQQAMPSTPINVNTATAEELAAIPGLDQTLAQNIIDYREANGPFASVDDLSRVSGMDQQTLDSIRGWITVEQGGGMPEQSPGQMPEQLPEQGPGQTPEQSPGGMEGGGV